MLHAAQQQKRALPHADGAIHRPLAAGEAIELRCTSGGFSPTAVLPGTASNIHRGGGTVASAQYLPYWVQRGSDRIEIAGPHANAGVLGGIVAGAGSVGGALCVPLLPVHTGLG